MKQGPLESCPICDGDSLAALFERHRVPTVLNRLYAGCSRARHAFTGQLDIVVCRSCGFAFNRRFNPSLVTYDTDYENDQGSSPAFAAYVSAMADRVLRSLDGRDSLEILEIGCGQGGFLRALVERSAGRIATAIGCDPAWRSPPPPAPIRIERRIFDSTLMRHAAIQVDAVVSRHVIEHVPEPLHFLREIRKALPASWNGPLFLETPSLEWILRNSISYDFFYEHCSYFSAPALQYALARAGFRPRIIEPVFGGQYYWVEAEGSESQAPELPEVEELIDLTAIYKTQTDDTISRWQVRLPQLRAHGGVAIWGAGAKGITLANAIDPTAQWITCLIDINPAKQDRFTPMSAHYVCSPLQAAQRGVATVIVANPNYRSEVKATLKELGIPATLLDP
jgi:SAM-dependent methyltransferase